MNCDAMLVRMLDAEPGELEGRGPSALARHVRTCWRCGAVAGRLVAETRALATAVGRPMVPELTVRPARRSRRLVIGAAVTSLAASILVAAFVQYSLHARITVDRPEREGVTLPRTPSELASGRTGTIAARIAAPADSSVTTGYPVEPVALSATRFADAQPVQEVPLAPTPAAGASLPAASVALPAAEPAVVSIDPPAGTRATIMRGRNPAITVVWLY
jgi:hypothetical protein